MTKTTALYKVLNFGRQKEHELIREGKSHEAYQIEHARNEMIFALSHSIKLLRIRLVLMTTYSIDKEGYWEYDPEYFVSDEFTRNLVEEFMGQFSKKEVK